MMIAFRAAVGSWERTHVAFIAAFFAALLATSILVFSLDLSLPRADPWLYVGKRNYTAWCEYQKDLGFVRARVATYTSFCYYAVGVYIFLCGIYDGAFRPTPSFNKLTSHPVLSISYGLVNILHGLAVLYNHASGTNPGGNLDQSFMRGVIFFPFVFIIYIIFPNIHTNSRKISTSYPFCFVYLASVVLFIVESFHRLPYFDFAFFAPLMGVDLVGSFILYFIFDGRPCRSRPYKYSIHLKFLIMVVIALCVGLGVWYPEYMFSLCIAGTGPHTFVQAHGLWHFFTALGILFSYLFMRTMESESAIEAIFSAKPPRAEHEETSIELEEARVDAMATSSSAEAIEDRPVAESDGHRT